MMLCRLTSPTRKIKEKITVTRLTMRLITIACNVRNL